MLMYGNEPDSSLRWIMATTERKTKKSYLSGTENKVLIGEVEVTELLILLFTQFLCSARTVKAQASIMQRCTQASPQFLYVYGDQADWFPPCQNGRAS